MARSTSRDSYPDTIEFRGIVLDTKEDINNTVDKDFDIFSYRDGSKDHALIVGIRNDSVRTLDESSSLYLSNFERQGFEFDGDGARQLGIKDNEVIYLTALNDIEGVVIYIEKDETPNDRDRSDDEGVFTDLEDLSF
ncbi:MAG: hypothetical protein GY811_21780 [Myxococcales bacterium]|nr:hypothetical protein [Myxococcales bacterium]